MTHGIIFAATITQYILRAAYCMSLRQHAKGCDVDVVDVDSEDVVNFMVGYFIVHVNLY